jgi:Dyp-type peroxidase family
MPPVEVPTTRVLSDESLSNIQGNILAPFNNHHQFFLFLNFGNSTSRARAWLTELAEPLATFNGGVAPTTDAVRLRRDAWKNAGGKPPDIARWLGVSFTSWGLVTLHPELAPDLAVQDAFWRGAFADRADPAQGRIASPALIGLPTAAELREWTIGGPDNAPVDALLTIAADDVDSLRNAVQIVGDHAVGHGLEVLGETLEAGFPRFGYYGHHLEGAIEHFGFRDGVSRPGIRGFTTPDDRSRRRETVGDPGSPIIAAGEFVLGYERESGSYPDTLLPDPPAWMHDGSFQVFLRLTQDVFRWRTTMADLSAEHGVDMEVKAIGRNKDGTPIAPPVPPDKLNDFAYADDPQGVDTPRFAHTRTMNPRDDVQFHDRRRRILRRGIPFGEPLDDAAAADGVERGLLFNAYMASIDEQFEFLMRNWASSPASLPPPSRVADGPDPLVGASLGECRLRRRNQASVPVRFERLVKTTGAVYAFAPSVATLRRLGSVESMRPG